MATGSAAPSAESPFADSDLEAIQGIGIAGFKKDHQELIFLTLGSRADAKALVGALSQRVANAEEVADFNEDFSAALHAHGQDPDMKALWTGLGISASGLAKLGAALSDMTSGPGRDAFVAGRGEGAGKTGDGGGEEPSKWLPGLRTKGGGAGIPA